MHIPKWKCVSFVQLRWLVSYPLQGHVRNSFRATIVNRQADTLMTSAPYIHTFHSGFLSFSIFVKMQNLRMFYIRFRTLLDWNDVPLHRIVWPMVDSHRKPSGHDSSGTQKPSNMIVAPNHSIRWWWLLWKPSKNCDGKINHVCQIWLLTANF